MLSNTVVLETETHVEIAGYEETMTPGRQRRCSESLDISSRFMSFVICRPQREIVPGAWTWTFGPTKS